MEKQLLEREALYAKVPPPGDRIPCNVSTTDIEYNKPQDKEICPMVVAVKRGKAKSIDLVQAKHTKTNLWGIECKEDYKEEARKEEEETGIPLDLTKPIKCTGWGYQWLKFVAVIQSIWRTGVIPRHLLWTSIVLIPKRNSRDFRGIILM